MKGEQQPYDPTHPYAHPKAREVVDYCQEILEQAKDGRITRIPYYSQIGESYNVKKRTVYRILQRSNLTDELRSAKEGLKKRIVDVYAEAIVEINEGNTSVVPTYREIGKIYGIKAPTISKLVKDNNLDQKLKEAKEKSKNVFKPSQECAWFLGILVGTSGYVNDTKSGSVIRLTHENEETLQSFMNTGIALMKKDNPKITARLVKAEGNQNKSVNFRSRIHAKALGDFSAPEKTNSIREQHSWVLDDNYIRSFTSGLFDSNGFIKIAPDSNMIELYTIYPDVAQFYTETLVRLGVQHVIIKKDSTSKFGINGVVVRQINDIKGLAEKIRSVNPEKQKLLDAAKMLTKKKRRVIRVTSANEILDEWKAITEKLGHTPSQREITLLKAEGKTKYSQTIYARYFGLDEKQRHTFKVAKSKLEKLTAPDTDPQEVQREIKKIKVKIKNQKFEKEDIAEEWDRLTRELGYIPNTTTIMTLYREGKTQYNVNAYIRHFGKTKDVPQGKFSIAQEVLQNLTSKTEEQERIIYP